VCAAGALDAQITRLDGEPCALEARYHFASREAFQVYERDHAPRLREQGLRRVPPQGGVRFARSTGEVIAQGDEP